MQKNFLHYTYSTKQFTDENCLPHTRVSLQQRQTGKLFEPCETKAASVRNPVGSENIHICHAA